LSTKNNKKQNNKKIPTKANKSQQKLKKQTEKNKAIKQIFASSTVSI